MRYFVLFQAESTQSFKDAVGPLLRECMGQVDGVTEDDFQTVYNRNKVETHSTKCLLWCLYKSLGCYLPDGQLKAGDEMMPIIDKLYGFKEFKTVFRAQVVNNCVHEVNAESSEDCEKAADFLHCLIVHY
ncbi:hypothetical protein C0J52_01960 [Blattella germanica]|nr:hypothetical protein C0J52_01960 [Blattella germanica]